MSASKRWRHSAEFRAAVRGTGGGSMRNALRALTFYLLVLLADAMTSPLPAQQQPSGGLFQAAPGQEVYAPLLKSTGVARHALTALDIQGGHVAGVGIASGPEEGRSNTALMAGGLAGGVVGLFMGGLVGAQVARHDCDTGCDESALILAIFGAMAGESIMLPLGVHLTNRRQGSYLPAMLTSVALTAGGILLAESLSETTVRHSAPTVLLITVPVMQLATSILIERRTARR